MFHKNQNTESYWQDIESPIYLPLDENLKTQVCVVGAGIAGLTTAYLLLKNGFAVTVIEKESLAENETARTSAHLSSILDEGFSALIDMHGEEDARKIYSSHCDAINLIEKIVEEESIDCDFKRVPGLLYQSPDTEKDYLKKELEAAYRLGCEDVQLLLSPLQFADYGPALEFQNQAQFHSVKYLNGLAKAITKMGGRIYTQTRAVQFNDETIEVTTERGWMISAEHIIVTTNVPVNDLLRIHTKEQAYRSYVLGIEIPKDQFPLALMWDTSDPYHYLRKIPDYSEWSDLLIVGGEDHRVGIDDEKEDHFANIQNWVETKLHIEGSILYRWSGQIIEPIDGIAFIGLNPGSKNISIICGDSGHGLTHSTLGAMILKDQLLNQENPWADIYSPQRVPFTELPTYIKDNAKTFFQYRDWLLAKPDDGPPLALNQGRVIREGMAPVAIYRDEDGEIYSFSAVCPHLAGVVRWNDQEKTWDCPCHGSRFACTGEVLNGPALSPLTPTHRGVLNAQNKISMDAPTIWRNGKEK